MLLKVIQSLVLHLEIIKKRRITLIEFQLLILILMYLRVVVPDG